MGIDVLVPVLGRPHNAEPLARSLEVTQTPFRLLFICNHDDPAEIAACEAVGEVLIVPWSAGKADFAKKINYAFERTENEWLFQGADDIRFSPGWDHHALMVARKRERKVIGTNDLHNPLVKRAAHSTHTLFARSYIEEQGGTFDGSGTVFSEEYDHQFVDSEFCETAKRRGVWAFSKQSIVEHFHPHWGNAPDDPTYRKSARDAAGDRRLYMQRMGFHSRITRDQRRAARHVRRA